MRTSTCTELWTETATFVAFTRGGRARARIAHRSAILAALLLASCKESEQSAPAPISSTAAAPSARPGSAPAGAAPADLDESVFANLPGRTVAGRIVDIAGKPLPDVVVSVRTEPGGSRRPAPEVPAVIDQRDKTFLPRVLPVLAGSRVVFRNSDVVLHNAYSRSLPKAFDLGAFSKSEEKSVVLDAPGRVDVFCAIHTNMHSIILVLDTPHFATTDARGVFQIAKLPSGKHTLTLWHEAHSEQKVPVEVSGEQATIVKQTLRKD